MTTSSSRKNRQSKVKKPTVNQVPEPAVDGDVKHLDIDVKGKKYVEIDHLDETPMTQTEHGDFRNLHYLVVSFISPDHIQNNSSLKHGMLKIWGGFPADSSGSSRNLEKAQLYCNYLRERTNAEGRNVGGYFDYFVCEGGKWITTL